MPEIHFTAFILVNHIYRIFKSVLAYVLNIFFILLFFSVVRNRDERIYHVQYFGKKVQHGWTTPGSTFSFEGEESFYKRKQELLDKVTTISDRKKVIMKYNVLV